MTASKRGRHCRNSALVLISIACCSLFVGTANADLGGLLYRGDTKLGHDVAFGQGLRSKITSTINSQPQTLWLGQFGGSDRVTAYEHVYKAITRGEIPTILLYNIPFRDCLQASKGGAATYAEYQQWVNDVSYGIADALNQAGREGTDHPDVPVVVLLESDSIALIPVNNDINDPRGSSNCFKRFESGNLMLDADGYPQQLFDPAERFANLSQAIDKLTYAAGFGCNLQSGKRPSSCNSWQSRVRVYLDAGHSNWASGWSGNWPAEIAHRLIKAGIQKAAGFFTNVSNYQPLGDPNDPERRHGELPFGKAVRDELLASISRGNPYGWGLDLCNGQLCAMPPKNQIIDVGRNGAIVDSNNPQPNGWPGFCDNQAARIGQAPTANTRSLLGVDFVDALLWVKPPGETDGCWGGPSTAANTQPSFDSLLSESGSRPGSTAGWPSPNLACGLLTGIYNNPKYGLGTPIECASGFTIPNPFGDPITSYITPQAPQGVRIAAYDLAKDTVTLEWQPSPGACAYIVGTAFNNSTGFTAVNRPGQYIPAEGEHGPATRYVVSPAAHGTKVKYAVKARWCGETSVYSAYGSSPAAVTTLFQ